jgi:hypothetical protein
MVRFARAARFVPIAVRAYRITRGVTIACDDASFVRALGYFRAVATALFVLASLITLAEQARHVRAKQRRA